MVYTNFDNVLTVFMNEFAKNKYTALFDSKRSHEKSINLKSIQCQILFVVCIATLTFTVYVAIILLHSNNQATLLEDIRDKHYPVQAKLERSFFTLRIIHSKIQDAVTTGEIDPLREANLLKKEFLDHIQAINKIDPTKKILSEHISKEFLAFFEGSYELAQKLINNAIAESELIEGKRVAKQYETLLQLLESSNRSEFIQFSKAIGQVTERANIIVHIGSTIGLATIVIIFLLALANSRKITHRIRNIIDILYDITTNNGDMSTRITMDGSDEMTELAYWFNRFIAKLEKITSDSTNEIRRLAYLDTLTNLPNRRLFNIRLQEEIEYCKRENLQIAVMFLDLDNFKTVNDQKGHKAGDQLVCEIGARLKGVLRKYDTVDFAEGGSPLGDTQNSNGSIVARMGGDEFMLIISRIKQSKNDNKNIIESTASRILTTTLAPIEIDDSPIEIGVSIGVAVFP